MEALEAAVAGAEHLKDIEECAKYYRNPVLMQMEKTRAIADEIENNVGAVSYTHLQWYLHGSLASQTGAESAKPVY